MNNQVSKQMGNAVKYFRTIFTLLFKKLTGNMLALHRWKPTNDDMVSTLFMNK